MKIFGVAVGWRAEHLISVIKIERGAADGIEIYAAFIGVGFRGSYFQRSILGVFNYDSEGNPDFVGQIDSDGFGLDEDAIAHDVNAANAGVGNGGSGGSENLNSAGEIYFGRIDLENDAGDGFIFGIIPGEDGGAAVLRDGEIARVGSESGIVNLRIDGDGAFYFFGRDSGNVDAKETVFSGAKL